MDNEGEGFVVCNKKQSIEMKKNSNSSHQSGNNLNISGNSEVQTSAESVAKKIKLSTALILKLQEKKRVDSTIAKEPGPLGLQLTKTPSLLSTLDKFCASKDKKKRQENEGSSSSHEKTRSAKGVDEKDRFKAGNFPATFIKIGAWQRMAKHEGDLIVKLYYAKRKIVWEILEGPLKSKIEILWDDICAIRATTLENEPGILDIELIRPPVYYRETSPQPRKHTLWQQSSDFTGGQAPIWRRHHVTFPSGILDKNFEKLLQCDARLTDLSNKPFPSHKSPYFDPTLFEATLNFRGYGANKAAQYPYRSYSSTLPREPLFRATPNPSRSVMDRQVTHQGGGNYHFASPNQGGNYQFAAPNPGGNYQFAALNQGGNYQFAAPNQGGNYQFAAPNQGGNYQFAAPNQGGNYQFAAPNQGGNYQFPAPNLGGNYQFAAPNQGGNYQFAAPNQGGNYQFAAPNQGGNYQRAAPNQGGNYQFAAPNQGGNYQRAAPNQGGNYQLAAPNQASWRDQSISIPTDNFGIHGTFGIPSTENDNNVCDPSYYDPNMSGLLTDIQTNLLDNVQLNNTLLETVGSMSSQMEPMGINNNNINDLSFQPDMAFHGITGDQGSNNNYELNGLAFHAITGNQGTNNGLNDKAFHSITGDQGSNSSHGLNGTTFHAMTGDQAINNNYGLNNTAFHSITGDQAINNNYGLNSTAFHAITGDQGSNNYGLNNTAFHATTGDQGNNNNNCGLNNMAFHATTGDQSNNNNCGLNNTAFHATTGDQGSNNNYGFNDTAFHATSGDQGINDNHGLNGTTSNAITEDQGSNNNYGSNDTAFNAITEDQGTNNNYGVNGTAFNAITGDQESNKNHELNGTISDPIDWLAVECSSENVPFEGASENLFELDAAGNNDFFNLFPF